MTKLQELQNELTYHTASRKDLLEKTGKSYRLLLKSGFPIEGVIASYDRIIASLETEIAGIEAKAAARKQPQKKATTKKTPKKKTSNKKKAAK
jgi:hypothetical protein